MFENPRRGRQARNFTTNAPKILDLKSSSEQIFFRKLSLGAPVATTSFFTEPVWKVLSSFFAKFVQSWLNSYFCPVWTGNQWQKKGSLNAWARAGKQIKLFTFLFLCFLVWPYNKHLINQARSVCMGESWPRSLVQTSLRSVCTGDLGQDSPIQTSRSVNKS